MVNVGELEVGMPNGCQERKMNVLGCSMARRKSRASIELGVQNLKDFKSGLLNRFDKAPSRLRLRNLMNCLGSSRVGWSPNRFVFTQISNLTFEKPSESILPLLNRLQRVLEGSRGLDAQPTATADHRE
ncbi:hypothetical protein PIB30_094949 [Stylosanthes scabra]|uniref:Uncharacterized protein n=1 Tax=Stylosanthes scabra TaxID=79078 RepID=A0ABU6ZUX3_9FABA|nr:hypothetical protein [Stylosanthes scabra]